ncbi:hypothetical protein BV22DRAFT_1041215 [Leucogyrophana mollusca]|uniref:Uncharacterized protein n=1 Tax=Leucogyrophana mollusca TaxID=85980 RepID=A0ACB8B0M3_9AGAM|nr:hypothetical protein BV22DRAFT_1041215 [Leucogyrophana mollusca]
MHSCLLIPELSCLIFESLHPLLTQDPKCHLQDLAALARTCRSLSASALDVLWHTQDSLGPLVLCMGDSIVEATEDKIARNAARAPVTGSDQVQHTDTMTNKFGDTYYRIRLKRQPIPADWERVLPYAQRIKIVSSASGTNLWRPRGRWVLDDSVTTALAAAFPTIPLLPRLSSLEYSAVAPASNDAFASLASVLLNGNMTHLRMHVSKDLEQSDVGSVLNALPEKCPWMKDLRIALDIKNPVILSKVPSWLAPLRFIEHLDLQMRFAEGAPESPSPDDFLPRLRTLRLTGKRTYSIPFIQSIQSQQLEEIRLILVGQLTGRALSALCTTVTSKPGWLASLRFISLSGGDPVGETSHGGVCLSAKDLCAFV